MTGSTTLRVYRLNLLNCSTVTGFMQVRILSPVFMNKTKTTPYYRLTSDALFLSSSWNFPRAYFKFVKFKNKGKSILKNSNFIVGLASVGLFSNLFVLCAGENLAQPTANTFSAVGLLALFVAFITFILSQKSSREQSNERDDMYRDFDVYRRIDDVERDMIHLNRELISNCASTKTCSRK